MSNSRSPWRARLKGWSIQLAILLVLFALLEAYVRYAHTPSEGLTRYVFIQEMTADRWSQVLEEHEGSAEEVLDALEAERLPTRRPNDAWTEQPEHWRPPYDRIRVGYAVKTNGDGFRDAPFEKVKPPGVRRVFVLGDSVAFGKGLFPEERFSDVWAARGRPGVQVWNLSYPACGTACQIGFLKEMLPFEPDLVVIQPSGNDVDTTMARLADRSRPGALSVVMRTVMRSRVIQALAYTLFSDAKAGQIDASVRATAEQYAALLDELFGLCRDAGAPAVVVMFPGSNDAWYGEHVAAACERRPGDCLGVIRAGLDRAAELVPDWKDVTGAGDESEPAWVRETAEAMDLPLDVLASLFPHRRFFFDIVHPNALAHRVVAAQLERLLAEKWPAPRMSGP